MELGKDYFEDEKSLTVDFERGLISPTHVKSEALEAEEAEALEEKEAATSHA
jgi:hypothetical protein